MVKRLYIVTSIVHLYRDTIFTPEERYVQTIKTIESIYNHDPGAKIVVIEGSLPNYGKVKFENVHMYYMKNPLLLYVAHKSVGEAELLKDFLLSEEFDKLSADIDIIFKVSGRYLLKNVDLTKFVTDKITTRRIYMQHVINEDKSAFITILFSFPKKKTDFMINRLNIVINRCNNFNGCDIEQSIFYGIEETEMNYIDYIGVIGIQAPDGKEVNY